MIVVTDKHRLFRVVPDDKAAKLLMKSLARTTQHEIITYSKEVTGESYRPARD